MKFCLECNRRPVTRHHFLCYRCDRKERRRDLEALEEKQERQFKYNSRELAQQLFARMED